MLSSAHSVVSDFKSAGQLPERRRVLVGCDPGEEEYCRDLFFFQDFRDCCHSGVVRIPFKDQADNPFVGFNSAQQRNRICHNLRLRCYCPGHRVRVSFRTVCNLRECAARERNQDADHKQNENSVSLPHLSVSTMKSSASFALSVSIPLRTSSDWSRSCSRLINFSSML